MLDSCFLACGLGAGGAEGGSLGSVAELYFTESNHNVRRRPQTTLMVHENGS